MKIWPPFVAATALATSMPAYAEEDRLARLERQLAEQQQRIRQLEATVAQQQARLDRTTTDNQAVPQQAAASSTGTRTDPATPPAFAAVPALLPAARIPGLDVGGDLRVRQEWNVGDADTRDRSRSVVRARLRASYAVNARLTVGAQIATGDPDDPNSTDMTLGNFVDDLAVSLDQAWLRYSAGGLTAWAGKFPQIFRRTDMVWDGDVVPQGVGGGYDAALGGDGTIGVRGMYFVIDEAPTARDSDMLGGQVMATVPLSSTLKIDLATSYYHYRLGSVAGADVGDFRGNRIAGGRYLSRFRLVEGLGTIVWSGPGERWPIALTADYVRNPGATAGRDDGFNVELSAGRAARSGDWRIAYNYSQVGVDAVFAAFSHDNLDLSTNYRLHGLSIAHVPASDLQFDLVFYHYRPLDPLFAGTHAPDDWLNRVRLNFMVNF